MRIVSLAPSNTEILYALGLDDQVIACTHFCDWPAQAKGKAKVGGWINTDPDKLRELKPDLILTSYFLPEPLRDWSGPGHVLHLAPKTLEDIFQSILHIGQATGKTPQANVLVDRMRTELESLRRAQSGSPVRVYLEEWFKPPMVSGNWVPELVAIAGGQQALAKPGHPSTEYSLDHLRAFDPEVMIFHWCGWGERFDSKQVLNRSGWSDFRAIRDQKVFAMDDSLLNRPGPRIVDGARRLAELLRT